MAEPRKKPNRTGVPVNTFIAGELALAMENFITDQEVEPKKTAVIQKALRKYLEEVGYYPLPTVGEPYPRPRPEKEPPGLKLVGRPDGFEHLSHPIRGTISCGKLVELQDEQEGQLEMGRLLGRDDLVVYRAAGDSMLDDGVWDGDHIFIRETPEAENGDVVLAQVGDLATLKRYYLKANRNGERVVRLEPRSPKLDIAPVEFELGSRPFRIVGTLHLVMHLPPPPRPRKRAAR